MEWNLKNRAVNLEEQFFANRDAELVKKLAEDLKAKEGKAALAEASGINDDSVLTELYDLGINPTTLAALSMVPLVEVAWADEELDKREKGAILKASAEKNINPGSASYELLEAWLQEKPSTDFREAWLDYVKAVCANLSAENKNKFHQEIMGSARKIASASGGILGMIDKISNAEEKMLAFLDTAFE